MRKIGIFAIALTLASCGQKQAATETVSTPVASETVVAEEYAPGMTFRSDGFHNGIASEWFEVVYKDNGEVAKLYFWDTNNETKNIVEIIEQRIGGDETTSVNIGKLKFAGNPSAYEFKIQEELFSLIDSDGNTQEFDMEREEM